MEQVRTVHTPNGPVSYILTRKKVKNLNLRIGNDDTVRLSIPVGCTTEQADAFVIGKSGWILQHQQRLRAEVLLLPEQDERTAKSVLEAAVDRVYPLIEACGVARPRLKIRRMYSQWGNCHWADGYITLNSTLCRCPEHLRDYVALHELIHFLHQDHGQGFYALFDRLMPDWKTRRKELKAYAGAIRK